MGNSEKKEDTKNLVQQKEDNELNSDIDYLVDKTIQNWDDNEKLLTVLICGPSQSGKSTLINKMFGFNEAKVTTDLNPTTKEPEIYDKPEKFLRLIDTHGFERTGGNTFLNGIQKPHVIWLVLNAQETIQPCDFQILQHFPDVPTLVILNKSTAIRNGTENDTKFFDLVEEDKLPIPYQNSEKLKNTRKQLIDQKKAHQNIKRILVVSLKKDEDNDKDPPIGLTTLYECTLVCIDNCLRLVFIENVTAFGKKKIITSVSIITSHVALASGVSWIPVPALDSIIITGFQITMIMALFSIWGVGYKKKTYAIAFLKGAAPALFTFGIGYGIAQVLKFIPLYGTIAGGALSMTFASLATLTIGVIVTLYLRIHVVGKFQDMKGSELEDSVKQFVKSPDVMKFLNSVPKLMSTGDLENGIEKFEKKDYRRESVVE